MFSIAKYGTLKTCSADSYILCILNLVCRHKYEHLFLIDISTELQNDFKRKIYDLHSTNNGEPSQKS